MVLLFPKQPGWEQLTFHRNDAGGHTGTAAKALSGTALYSQALDLHSTPPSTSKGLTGLSVASLRYHLLPNVPNTIMSVPLFEIYRVTCVEMLQKCTIL